MKFSIIKVKTKNELVSTEFIFREIKGTEIKGLERETNTYENRIFEIIMEKMDYSINSVGMIV